MDILKIVARCMPFHFVVDSGGDPDEVASSYLDDCVLDAKPTCTIKNLNHNIIK